MKHIVLPLSFFLLIFFQSCSKKREVQLFDSGQIIPVEFNTNRYLPLDSFIDNVTVIPLETNDSCLIRQLVLQVKEHQGLIYLNNFMRQLLVFDMKGNFIREIGRRGQGPGEFLEVRDFLFTNENTIEILDFKKIEHYTLDGKYIETVKKFDYIGKEFYFNPMSFCRSYSKGYYLWGGMLHGGNEKLLESGYLMYRVNKDIQIEAGFFDKKYGDGGNMDRFKYYQDKILITLSSLNYNIYQINQNDSLNIRYTFDFGKYGYEIKEDFDRKTVPIENYISGIRYFQETDDFLYFNFSYQKIIHCLLYSKTTGQTYIKSLAPSENEKEIRLFPADAIYKDQLVALVEPFVLKMDLERMSPENIKKWGLEDFLKLDDEDNPVLILYKTKIGYLQ